MEGVRYEPLLFMQEIDNSVVMLFILESEVKSIKIIIIIIMDLRSVSASKDVIGDPSSRKYVISIIFCQTKSRFLHVFILF